MKRFYLYLLIFIIFIVPASVFAEGKPGLLLPIGAGYTDTYNGMAKFAIENAKNGVVHILILASPYSTNSQVILEGEFNQNMKDAEERRLQTEGACQRNLPKDSTLVCKVELLPIFSQVDANKPDNLRFFTDDVSMIFILGGDQETGMGAIINTPVEKRINALHGQGTIISGTSAGAAMQSRFMIASLEQSYTISDSLFAGAVRLWNDQDHRGFEFGVKNAIVDQHFYQRARMGRLLNVITQPGNPHIGVGVDAYTGVASDGEVLRDVFGLYTVTILDAETYHSADGIKYVNIPGKKTPIISLRNIVLNLISPSNVTYDINTRTSSFGPVPSKMTRKFDSFNSQKGAGPLYLGGNQLETEGENTVIEEFKKDAGSNILIIATGYPSNRSSDAAIKSYTALLGGAPRSITVVDDTPVVIPEEVTGILVISKDQSKAHIKALTPIKAFWMKGNAVMADNAAAPLFGSFYSNHPPTPTDPELEEIATQRSFWQGRTEIAPGLGWVKFNLEPQMMEDLRFGRLFSLAYNKPQTIAVGLNSGSAMKVTMDGSTCIGQNGIFVLDTRRARLKIGTNEGFNIGNALLDVFAPGDLMIPVEADIDAKYVVAATPIVPTLVPSPTPTQKITVTPVSSETPSNVAVATNEVVQADNFSAQAPINFPRMIYLISCVVAIIWFGRKYILNKK